MKKIKIVLSLIFILLIIYFSGVIYFHKFSYPKTFINGVKKGNVVIENILNKYPDKYVLSIVGRNNKSLKLKGIDIDLNYSIKGVSKINQNPWYWPYGIFTKHNYMINYVYKYDKNKLNNIVKSSELLKNEKKPHDAYIKFDNNKLLKVREIYGDKLVFNKLILSIEKSINKYYTKLILNKEYLSPRIKISDSEYLKFFSLLDKYVKNKIIFDFVDRKFEIGAKELLKFFDYKNSKYILNEDKVYNYVYDIADETNTYARSHKFIATDIGEITVPGGIYGWRMDIEKTSKKVVKMIKDSKYGKVKIDYLRTANHRGKDDIGNTYIEIDLSRQKLWYYKKGKLLIETLVITGDTRKRSAATPTGVNMIWSKERKKVLYGNNAISGEPYEYPVEYFMPVGWTHSAIHDNRDRESFGGNIYLNHGSSSCIQTPPNIMKELYELTDLYTPVVIYESSTNFSPSEFEKQEMMRR